VGRTIRKTINKRKKTGVKSYSATHSEKEGQQKGLATGQFFSVTDEPKTDPIGIYSESI
jgi:hypothetical protein